MRLLVVVPYYKPAYIYGGPTRSTAALCEAIARAGHDVTVYTTDAAGKHSLQVPASRVANVCGVRVHYFRRTQAWRPMRFSSPDLAQACRETASEYEAMYIGGQWTYPFYAAAKAAISAGVPYLISPRGSFMKWAMRQGSLKKRLYLELVERPLIEGARGIHYTTQLEARETARFGFGPGPLVIPNGIETSLFCDLPAKGEWRSKLCLRDSDRLSIFSGRLVKDKRVPLIVRSFALASRGLTNAYLAIAGPDYGELGEIEATIGELGLSKRVFLLGDLSWDDLLRLYVDADMLALLSWRENFGMAIAEAMAAGCPILACEGVGLADEVRRAGAGLVVRRDLSDAGQVWRRMIEDTDLDRFGRNGRAYALRHFSSDNVARKVVEAFLEPKWSAAELRPSVCRSGG